MNPIQYNGNKNYVWARLKEARKLRGFSQRTLAKKMQLMDVKIDQKAISRIEKNERITTDYEVVCFAKVLKVDRDWLMADLIQFLDENF